MKKDINFWLIQVPGWLLLCYLVYAQAIPAFNYETGVDMGTHGCGVLVRFRICRPGYIESLQLIVAPDEIISSPPYKKSLACNHGKHVLHFGGGV